MSGKNTFSSPCQSAAMSMILLTPFGFCPEKLRSRLHSSVMAETHRTKTENSFKSFCEWNCANKKMGKKGSVSGKGAESTKGEKGTVGENGLPGIWRPTGKKGVGPTYGRKMMTGHLSSKGINVSEARVGEALATVNPRYHHLRQQGSRNFNPVPHQADHFGHKIHLDQNEKNVWFEVCLDELQNHEFQKMGEISCNEVKLHESRNKVQLVFIVIHNGFKELSHQTGLFDAAR
ncbi:unnamed protein product [Mytilus coruscus]|uniref:Uncharacterized protein n=1 Tax=Mytilus coruscus TaxID=42192 RepID=A0A6J8EKB8_MYTCO|nr:unnamed protein product [Mytilus coruscus]